MDDFSSRAHKLPNISCYRDDLVIMIHKFLLLEDLRIKITPGNVLIRRLTNNSTLVRVQRGSISEKIKSSNFLKNIPFYRIN